MTQVLRPGVLEGVRVLVAGDGPLACAIVARFAALGADASPASETSPHVLVFDGAAAFSAAPGADAAQATLDGAWDAIRPAAQNPMLIVLLAPPPGGADAEAARAGLENLARTLSIEWARLGIRPVAIHPGAQTPAEEVAELAAFLASPAGAYYSGCRFDLR